MSISDDKLIPLGDVPKLLPDGVSVNLSTVLRWVTHGVKGRKLRHLRVGVRRFTRPSWLYEFLELDSAVQQ